MLTAQRRVDLGKITTEFLQSFLGEYNKEEKEYVISQLKRELSFSQEENTIEEMNYEQAKKFGTILMPFGLEKGRQIREISLDYLSRLTDPSDFMKKLKKYVAFRTNNTAIRV